MFVCCHRQENGNRNDNKKMKKFALYTAVFGKLGRGIHIPEVSIPDVDRFCYTDLDIENDFYEIKKMNLDPLIAIRRQRWIKVCIPDEIFDNYEYSVYVDCKRNSLINFEGLLNFMEPGSDLVTRQHKRRNCVYDEGKVCIEKRKDDEATILEQLDFYRRENYPVHNGLHYSFILLRRHTEKMKRFSQLWWQQMEKYSYRDQISLPYVAWKHGMKISICERNI